MRTKDIRGDTTYECKDGTLRYVQVKGIFPLKWVTYVNSWIVDKSGQRLEYAHETLNAFAKRAVKEYAK